MFSRGTEMQTRQLHLIREVAELLEGGGVRFWLSGGWAVDFRARRITREHSDVDIVVYHEDQPRLMALLAGAGLVPVGERPGIAWFERDGLRLETTFITESGEDLVTPGYESWPWPQESFPENEVSLSGVSVRAVSVGGLLDMKRGFAERLGRPRRSYDVADIDVLEGGA
jgi:hypothetical protein